MSAATAGADRADDLGTRLGRLIQQAWSKGWEPMDLHRMATRAGSPAMVALLGDLLAAELARYPAVTVEARWHTQLAEIGAQIWWPPQESPVAARADRTKGGWRTLRQAADLLEIALMTLPEIEHLGARPGQAQPSREPGHDVDQRMLSKVRLMLAKAESTTFAAEAETFTAAAQKLMTRHSIDRALLEQDSGAADGPSAIRLGVDRPYESARFHLVAAIARANRCKAVWQKGLGFSTVVGFPTDLRAVELLFTSLMVQATAAMTAAGSREHWSGQSRTRSFRRSFLTAFAMRIGERLEQAATEGQQEWEAAGDLAADSGEGAASSDAAPDGDARDAGTHDGAGKGSPTLHDRTALVRVLAARDEEVDAAVTQRFPRLRTQRRETTLDAEGWVTGTAAADRADLGAPGRLPR